MCFDGKQSQGSLWVCEVACGHTEVPSEARHPERPHGMRVSRPLHCELFACLHSPFPTPPGVMERVPGVAAPACSPSSAGLHVWAPPAVNL